MAGLIDRFKLHVERFKSLGAIPEMCDLAWKLCTENEHLAAALLRVTEHMDRAGGDAYGMSECPWCQAQGTSPGDDNWHVGDCELAAARELLAARES